MRRKFTTQNSDVVPALLMGQTDQHKINVRLQLRTLKKMKQNKNVVHADCLVIGDTHTALPLSISDEIVFNTLQDQCGQPYNGVIKAITVEPHKYSSFAHRFQVKVFFE